MMLVAPLVGAWIEIHSRNTKCDSARVAPLVGAWIEMFRDGGTLTPNTVAPDVV